MAPDLFPDTIPPPAPRARPRVMMHVIDAGDCIARYRCTRCGAESGWQPFATTTEAKRGIPCQACNQQPTPGQAGQ